jgi:hypothetical protein
MNPLFFPGVIGQLVSVFFFFIVIAAILGVGGYIYYQNIRIEALKSSLQNCEVQKSIVVSKAGFVTENLKILQKHCNKKRTDIFDKQGKLLEDKIFQVEPR